MTIREALVHGGARLAAAGIETAALDASLLLAEVLGKSRAALIAAGPETIAGEHSAAFEMLIERRKNGECTAYILGRKEFRGLDFAVNPAVLVPRPDTETLVEAAIAELRPMFRYPHTRTSGGAAGAEQTVRVLDLCTGSGAVAVALKNELPELEVWAADISPAALETARANAAHLISSASIQFRLGNLFEAIAPGCNRSVSSPVPLFSLIVSNPPYVPSGDIAGLAPEVQHEPRLALDGGGDGLDIIRAIITEAPRYLAAGGRLLLEADPRQMKKIASLLEQAGFGETRTYRDLSGQERVIDGRY